MNGTEPLGGDITPNLFTDIDSPSPSVITFEPIVHEAVINGYFYAPDGNTRLYTEIKVYQFSPYITMTSPAEIGSSGSPIFTANEDLI